MRAFLIFAVIAMILQLAEPSTASAVESGVPNCANMLSNLDKANDSTEGFNGATREFILRLRSGASSGIITKDILESLINDSTIKNPLSEKESLGIDLLPHFRAFQKLLEKSDDIDLRLVKDTAGEILRELKASSERKESNRTATASVLLKEITHRISDSNLVFDDSSLQVIEHSGKIYGVTKAFHTSSKQSELVIFDALEGKIIHSVSLEGIIDKHPSWFTGPDGRLYVVGGTIHYDSDPHLQVIDVESGKLFKDIPLGNDWKPDGPIAIRILKENLIFIATPAGHAKLLNPYTGEVTYDKPHVYRTKSYKRLDVPAFLETENGPLALFGSANDRLFVVDPMTGEQLHAVRLEKKKEQFRSPNIISSSPATFKRNGKDWAIRGSERGRIYLFQIDGGDKVIKLQTDSSTFSSPIVFELEGKSYGAIASMDECLYIIDLEKGEIDQKIRAKDGIRGPVSVVYNEYKKPILVASAGHYLEFFDPAQGISTGAIRVGENDENRHFFWRDNSLYVTFVADSSGSSEGGIYVVRIWGPPNG